MKFKACLNCGRLVPKDAEKCPYCGSKEFTENYKGVVFILDPEKSKIAKILGKNEEGIYALRIY